MLLPAPFSSQHRRPLPSVSFPSLIRLMLNGLVELWFAGGSAVWVHGFSGLLAVLILTCGQCSSEFIGGPVDGASVHRRFPIVTVCG